MFPSLHDWLVATKYLQIKVGNQIDLLGSCKLHLLEWVGRLPDRTGTRSSGPAHVGIPIARFKHGTPDWKREREREREREIEGEGGSGAGNVVGAAAAAPCQNCLLLRGKGGRRQRPRAGGGREGEGVVLAAEATTVLKRMFGVKSDPRNENELPLVGKY